MIYRMNNMMRHAMELLFGLHTHSHTYPCTCRHMGNAQCVQCTCYKHEQSTSRDVGNKSWGIPNHAMQCNARAMPSIYRMILPYSGQFVKDNYRKSIQAKFEAKACKTHNTKMDFVHKHIYLCK